MFFSSYVVFLAVRRIFVLGKYKSTVDKELLILKWHFTSFGSYNVCLGVFSSI